jgi:hypothetical protein
MAEKIKNIPNEYVILPVKVQISDFDDTIGTEFEDIVEIAENDIDVENFIRTLSVPEVEILLFRHLGFKGEEIYKIIGLRNIRTYYFISNKLKKSYRRFFENNEKK